MKRTLAVLLPAALVVGGTLSAGPAEAKLRCRSGYKRVGKRCKKVRKHTSGTSMAIAAKTFSGRVGSTTISLTPNAKAKTGAAVVNVSCTSAEGVAVSEKNGLSGETVKLYPVVLLQQTFTGGFSDGTTGASLNWSLTGTWTTATRFEGTFFGSATSATPTGFGGPSCFVPTTKIVLR